LQKGFGSRSSLIVFVLINIAWLGLVALWVYYSINNYQMVRKFSLRFQFGPAGVGPPWIVWFGAGILMLFLLLGIIVIYTYYRKQAALNLVHQNFISSVTHELRSPLASVQLYLETLLIRDPEEKVRKEFLERMQEETERLSALIQNILWVSRVQRLKVEYAFEWIPLSERLETYLEEKRRKHGWGPEELTSRIEPGIRIRCDWDNLTIAMDNLVENAHRYSPAGFWLEVAAESAGDGCLLAFRDRGPGIPKAEQKNVFKMFYRVGNEMTRTVKGTGLGLYIVENIVKAHGGRISLASGDRREGGTTFRLELPRNGPRPSRLQRGHLLSALPFRRG
jgi:signal transduction histidine kinase